MCDERCTVVEGGCLDVVLIAVAELLAYPAGIHVQTLAVGLGPRKTAWHVVVYQRRHSEGNNVRGQNHLPRILLEHSFVDARVEQPDKLECPNLKLA